MHVTVESHQCNPAGKLHNRTASRVHNGIKTEAVMSAVLGLFVVTFLLRWDMDYIHPSPPLQADQ